MVSVCVAAPVALYMFHWGLMNDAGAGWAVFSSVVFIALCPLVIAVVASFFEPSGEGKVEKELREAVKKAAA